MATATFNAGVDYFGLETATSNALKVRSSDAHRSDSLAEGENGKGDVVAQDRYAETAAPSADYGCVGSVSLSTISLGTVSTPTGFTKPVMLTEISFSTSAKSEVGCSATGVQVETGAVTKRTYALPTISFTPRHRAQDILSALTVKVAGQTASDTEAEITQANFKFSVNATLAQPKGVTLASDCHGGKVEATYTVQAWSSGAVTFEAATGYEMSVASEASPENGYTTYTVTLTKSITGTDVTTSAT